MFSKSDYHTKLRTSNGPENHKMYTAKDLNLENKPDVNELQNNDS